MAEVEKKNMETVRKDTSDNKYQKVADRAQRDRRDRRNRRPMRSKDDAPKEFDEVVINVNRVARVVKGGRRFRFQALVVVGNHKEKVGVGVAKGEDVQMAVSKATDKAKKNIVIVPIVNKTIPHDVEVKMTGAHVLVKPATLGTGIIAGGVVRQVVGVTGISNLISKSLGSTNKINIAYATLEALRQLVPRDKWLGAKPKPVKKTASKKGDK
ncbi:MAG: 30S ribosomal protein S5 [Candidatus Nomurabacteria bacterium]|jgi:small subunit ribosomal protein S5|nr:30S ribosomal protein S5 [Candidatus Nomurabacteria bacterium]